MDEFISSFTQWLHQELKLGEAIVHYDLDDDLDAAKGVNCFGLCYPEKDGSYTVIYVKRNRSLTDICLTIAHEMIHVNQFLFKNLKEELATKDMIEYANRWWEQEAIDMSIVYVKQYVNKIPNRLTATPDTV